MIMMWMNEASGIPIIQDKPRPHRTERKIEGFQTKQYGWEVFQVRDEESGRAANLVRLLSCMRLMIERLTTERNSLLKRSE